MTKTIQSRRWPLRGYLMLLAVLVMCVGLLRNQGDVSRVFDRVKVLAVPVIKIFKRDDGVSVHVQSGHTTAHVETTSRSDSKEKETAVSDDKIAEILGALVPPVSQVDSSAPQPVSENNESESQDQPKTTPQDQPNTQSQGESTIPPQACQEQLAPIKTISCQISSDYAKALYSGDYKSLRNLMAKGCCEVTAEMRDEEIDSLVRNGPGTYFKLIKLHQRKRLLIHKLLNRGNGITSRIISIQNGEDQSKIDPIGVALEDFDFAKAKHELIQLMDQKRSLAEGLGPLLKNVDAYATFQDFVARKCKPEGAQ